MCIAQSFYIAAHNFSQLKKEKNSSNLQFFSNYCKFYSMLMFNYDHKLNAVRSKIRFFRKKCGNSYKS
ncbi:hypothetical protein B1J93_19260 [Leptospira kirschneri serovar Pomona]|uniref:Uncharacterized protein n=1 Tax=Leptospira kirschneri serovar Pomona TaxID=561005 RepID=A0A1T1DFT7_9LEPT|nr:hypothetical protein B1J93_19260 [Leptospira kirschneri serovar Pomona]